MPYNPNKTYPNNRISPIYGEPVMSEPAGIANEIKSAVSPTGKPIMPGWLVTVATALVAVAGTALALPSMGVTLPPAAIAAASVVLAVGTALGIASPGIRKKE